MRSLNALKSRSINNDTLSKNRISLALNQTATTGASLGGGGGANTGDLMGQQAEMINNLKSIEPILQTAEKFLDKFENSSISKMFQNMGSIPGMSLLTGGGANGGGNGLNPASVGS